MLLGLAAPEARVYRHLLEHGAQRTADIATALGREGREVRAAVQALIDKGLVIARDAAEREVRLVRPDTALHRLVHERVAAIRCSQAAVANSYLASRWTAHPEVGEDLLEYATGEEALARLAHAERMVRSEVCRFEPAPGPGDHRPGPVELGNLRRGVAYRVVYAKRAVEDEDHYQRVIRPRIAEGEEARVLPDLPTQLTVFDGLTAFVSLCADGGPGDAAVLVVHSSGLLCALAGLFDHAWRAAYPMHVSEANPPQLRPVERQVLELLSCGLSDQLVAERLGISRRTFSRHMERLSHRAGAATRFQLALSATRNGWL